MVHINELGPITVNDYDNTSTDALTIQTLTDAQKLLQINRAKYTAFWVDKQDMAKAKGNFMAEAMRNQSFALANEVDEYIAGLYSDAGIVVSGTAAACTDITSTNVLKYISMIAQKHDEANTPAQGRWLAVPPWFYQKMLLSKIALDTSNSDALGTGFVGSYMGFNLYVSNNIEAVSDGHAILSGYPGSITLATQVTDTQVANTVTVGFKYLVKSLLVYGAKVVRPNNLAVLYADETAEAS